MVLIIDKNTEKTHYFPKNKSNFYEKFKLEIETGNVVTTIEVEDTLRYSNWYTFEIDFSTYQNGEYKYKLFGLNNEDFELCGYGLLHVGDIKPSNKTYVEKAEFIEYKSN